jgi:hypothetical protein
MYFHNEGLISSQNHRVYLSTFIEYKMKIGSAAAIFYVALATKQASSFSPVVGGTNSIAHHVSSLSKSSLYSAVAEAPPTETEEVYGTVVGDTKGAALMLTDVAISRGASPLLKDIEWSVQPNERWGIGAFLLSNF